MVGRLRRTHPAVLALPGVAIAGVALADLALTHQVVLGLVVVAPLLAASLCGPVVTGLYGALALAVGALLGIRNEAYVEANDALLAQVVRLSVIFAMSVVAVITSTYRLRREQRLTQVLKVAEVAQRAILLPVPDQLGPLRVAVRYDSAASEALIGGDMYGVVPTPFGLRVLVGDVRGKGLEAVRMSALVLAAFRERAADHRDLRVLVEHLDRAVARYAGDEDFVTAVLVQITDDGQVSIANAGHPPPLVVTADGARHLEPQTPRPPLGIAGRVRLDTFALAPGDRLLLYTDGLTEARQPGRGAFLPEQTIMTAVRGPTAVAQALATLRENVLAWSGDVLRDDVAMVLIEYAPVSGTPPCVPAPADAGAEAKSRTSPVGLLPFGTCAPPTLYG